MGIEEGQEGPSLTPYISELEAMGEIRAEEISAQPQMELPDSEDVTIPGSASLSGSELLPAA